MSSDDASTPGTAIRSLADLAVLLEGVARAQVWDHETCALFPNGATMASLVYSENAGGDPLGGSGMYVFYVDGEGPAEHGRFRFTVDQTGGD